MIDRRRPIAQVQSALTPTLLDVVQTLSRSRYPTAATLQRVRLRAAGPTAAEVFATYTRGGRVRAIAGRVELARTNRWQLVALQIG
ncbi:Rv3235 family protein [Mycobacterium hubeiense]|uniref:Rv3235 family protein n=1 Tax=Mycobacterium hubeiense TaxID=1867256 RepID=UPI003D66FF28